MQTYYTETRIFQVIDYNDPQMSQKEVVINQPTPAGEIINDITVGEYAVVIASAPARDNMMETQFAEAIQLREAGVQIPDDIVIENSHLNRKMEVAERVRQMLGMGEPTEEEIAEMQMMKEIEMQMTQLNMMELEAKVMKAQSEAGAIQAKGDVEMMNAQTLQQKTYADIQARIDEMRAGMHKHLTNLQSKEDLAQMHIDSNEAKTMYTSASKKMLEELKAKSMMATKGLGQGSTAGTQKPAANPPSGRKRRA